MTPETYLNDVRRMTLDDSTFVKLTLKGKGGADGDPFPWRQIVVRPVHIKNERQLQFSYFSARQDITKNYRDEDAAAHLDEALALPFSALDLQTAAGNWRVQITKKGAPIIHREATKEAVPQLLATNGGGHDHVKALPLPADQPDAYLQAVGIMDAQGKIRPAMHAKFAQVNAFLTLLDHERDQPFIHQPIHILDCGCGSAYLSFAAYHYLNDVCGVPARLTGIDSNGQLIDKDSIHAAELGYGDACFRTASIIDYAPDPPPDIVLALHACDTATDEALYLGVKYSAQVILCAPCCHHELRSQLDTQPSAAPFAPVLRHGILKQRMAELLTDSLRALLLRSMGYKTDVVEFVSPEHTDKNLLIRAVRTGRPGDAASRAALAEYDALKAFWTVTPYLEMLLAEAFLRLS